MLNAAKATVDRFIDYFEVIVDLNERDQMVNLFSALKRL